MNLTNLIEGDGKPHLQGEMMLRDLRIGRLRGLLEIIDEGLALEAPVERQATAAGQRLDTSTENLVFILNAE